MILTWLQYYHTRFSKKKKWKRGWNTNNSSDSSSITLNVMSKLKYLVDIHTVLNIGLSTDRM